MRTIPLARFRWKTEEDGMSAELQQAFLLVDGEEKKIEWRAVPRVVYDAPDADLREAIDEALMTLKG